MHANCHHIAAALADEMTNAGLEVSDNPNYKVWVYWCPLGNTDLVTFMARLPEGVEVSDTTAQKVIGHYNAGQEDNRLDLVQEAYGPNLKHKDFLDYEHWSLAMFCRIEEPLEEEGYYERTEPHITF